MFISVCLNKLELARFRHTDCGIMHASPILHSLNPIWIRLESGYDDFPRRILLLTICILLPCK